MKIASPEPKPAPLPNHPPAPGTYWQVVGATEMPALELYRKLREGRFDAVMHAGSDGLTRVLGGPYFDDQTADKAKKEMEAAGYKVLRRWE